MRRVLAVVVFAGCAQGGASAPGDSNNGQIDAPLAGDAPPMVDAAPMTDATPMVDATPMIDAAPMIDAPPPPPDACVPMVTELLGNPAFDVSPFTPPWTEVRYDSTIPLIGAFSVAPFSSPNYTWLGGYEPGIGDASDYVYQDFVVPPLTTQIVVSGYMRITSEDTFPNADEGFVGFLFPPAFTTPAIIVVHKTNTDAAQFAAWTPFSQTITTPLSGTTVRFQMESVSDFIDLTNFLFDSVSVKATHGCP